VGENFLEILGHKFEGAKYKLEIHGIDYKNFSETAKEKKSGEHKKEKQAV